MQVTAVGATGAADASDNRAGAHLLASRDVEGGEVCIQGLPAAAVIDHDHVAVAGVGAHGDNAGTAGQDWLAEVRLARAREVPVDGEARVAGVRAGEPHLPARERRLEFGTRRRGGRGWRTRDGDRARGGDGDYTAENSCQGARQDSGVSWHPDSLGR